MPLNGEFTEETKKALIGMTITDVGTDYIVLDGSVSIYLNEDEIINLNQIGEIN